MKYGQYLLRIRPLLDIFCPNNTILNERCIYNIRYHNELQLFDILLKCPIDSCLYVLNDKTHYTF